MSEGMNAMPTTSDAATEAATILEARGLRKSFGALEVLTVIRGLADEGMTMAIVTHEMAFAADVADRVLFLDQGTIAVQGMPDDTIRNPSHERLKAFVSRFNH